MNFGLTNPVLAQGPVTTDELTGKASKKDLANALLAVKANADQSKLTLTPPTQTTVTTPDAPPPPAPAAAPPAPYPDIAQPPSMGPPAPQGSPTAGFAPGSPSDPSSFSGPQAPQQGGVDPQAPQITQTGGGLALNAAPANAMPAFMNPSYAAASKDENGMPNAGGAGLSKLGKLLTVLRMTAQGAAVGSQYHNFGQGFAASEDFSDKQRATEQAAQQHAMSLQTQKAQLAMLPIQQKYQQLMLQKDADYKESQTAANNARASNQTALAALNDTKQSTAETTAGVGKPLLSKNAAGDNVWMQKDPKNPKADANGMVTLGPGPSAKPAPPVVKVFGNRSMQWNPATGAWDDKGAAPAERALPGGTGASGPASPLTPELQQQISALPAPQQAILSRYDSKTQSALMAVAHGDLPLSTFPARLTRGAPGMTQQDAAGLVKELWPQYNANLYQTKQKLQDDFTQMKGSGTGAQIGSFNTFLGHAADASDVAAAYRESGSPMINKSVNWLRANAAGDPGFTQLRAALYPVREEYLKFLKGNFAPQKEELAAMDRVMSDDSTPAQIQEALGTMAKQAVVRLDTINDGYKTVTGENWPNLIHPNRIASANKLGVGNEVAKYGSGGQLHGNMPHVAQAQQQPSASASGGKAAKYGVPIGQ